MKWTIEIQYNEMKMKNEVTNLQKEIGENAEEESDPVSEADEEGSETDCW